MEIPHLTNEQIQEKLTQHQYKAQSSYRAMYSSWFGGITTEASLMVIPVDDHLVHRGDGVFEAIKMVQGRVFLLNEHMSRLENSCEKIDLKLPFSRADIKKIIYEVLTVAKLESSMIRLFVSRGPGGFSANPYDSIGSQLYVVGTELAPMPEDKYQKGVKVGKSRIPLKDDFFAQIKTCNYLPNVLMKKESVDRSLDFTVGFDEQGFLTESSTENIVILNKDRILVRPHLRRILRGTTMMRVFELADSLLKSGQIAGIEERNISEKDILQAREVFMIGTTLDILPVTEFEGQAVQDGKVGAVAQELLKILKDDIRTGPCSTPLEKLNL